MTDTRTLTGDEVVAQVSALVEEIFERLKPVLAAAESLLAEPDGSTSVALHRIRPQVIEALGGLVIGAGFVSAPHVLSDQEFGFEWWTSPPGEGEPEQLFISLDPDSENFLDYTRQSWFTVPRDSGRRHINGPYVDYLCTDEYTLTFTLPVERDGFAGVVGADVYVREFERTVRRRLRSLGREAALLNAQGRVIVSNSVRQATGSLVRAVDVPAWWASGAEPYTTTGGLTLRRCGDSPIALLVTT